MRPYDRPGNQSGNYPEGQIYQQQVEREHRPLAKAEEPRAAQWQEDQKQSQQRREDV